MNQNEKKKDVVKNYTDLKVYQLAFNSAMEIFNLSKGWPTEERFSLTDQIRRSSRSVCGNIAKAWRKRRYPAHFISKFSGSDSEAAVTDVWLDFADRCNYLNKEDHSSLEDNYDHICRMLTKMMNSLDAWCSKKK